MTASTRGPGRRAIGQRLRAICSSRAPFVLLFASVLAINWGVAVWLLDYTHQQREAAVLRMIDDETRYAEKAVGDLFADADRTLHELRALEPSGDLTAVLERWTPPGNFAGSFGGIAFIAPDGYVMAATPRANTAGWPSLMGRLADSADVLAIGEPVPGLNGHLGSIPVARRVVGPGGTFEGILLYSLESEGFPGPSPGIAALDGFVALIRNDDVILARSPDVRGTIGMRMPGELSRMAPRDRLTGTVRRISPIDGVDRIISYRQMDKLPAVLITGVGYDRAFASWNVLRIGLIGARLGATVLIFVAGLFWYSRRGRARISSDALTAVLGGVEQGIRVENAARRVVAANDAGLIRVTPERAEAQVETPGRDGSVIRVARHDLPDGGAVFISTDLTERREMAARLAFLTDHDCLTGLPNRWAANARIEQFIAAKTGSARMAALIVFDLDGFQDINNTLGHDGGDEVLIEVSERLRGLVSGHDMVARLGGDEFLLFLDEPDDELAVMCLARQIPRALSRPISLRGQQVRLGASLGIALHPRDGTDAATLFRHADIALLRAKMAGRGTARSFEPAMMISFEEHRMMESDLRRALESDELQLRLQPQFSCETLEVTGFEALTRWRHPTRGDVSPAVFIPVAERSGLINPLGLWAIEQTCLTAATWPVRHRVAVNLSPLQLRCETIQDDIRAILRRTQFPAHLLELEVTESVLLDGDQRTLETLHKLRAMDIRVTLDDFGTGYSSLSYLRRFPFDKIKIDKSFIQGQGTDRGTRVILEAMIRMCTDLGFDVVAEGVETEAQLNELRQFGCREVQGFLLGEPLPPDMVEDFLTRADRRSGMERTQNARAPC